MWTRSVRRVMYLHTWRNVAWRLSFRSIRHAHWLLFLWLVWHHWLKFCYYISSLILHLLCCLTVTCTKKPKVLAILQCDLDSRTFIWCVRPLQIYRRSIMSHNFVTAIMKKLIKIKIGKYLALHYDHKSKITVGISIFPQTQEPSPALYRNLISIW